MSSDQTREDNVSGLPPIDYEYAMGLVRTDAELGRPKQTPPSGDARGHPAEGDTPDDLPDEDDTGDFRAPPDTSADADIAAMLQSIGDDPPPARRLAGHRALGLTPQQRRQRDWSNLMRAANSGDPDAPAQDATLDKVVESVDSGVSALDYSLTQLEERMATVDDSVQENLDGLRALDESVRGVDESVQGVKAGLDDATEELVGVNGNLETLASKMATLATRVEGIEARFESLEKLLLRIAVAAEANAKTSAANAEHNSQVARHFRNNK